MPFEPGECPEDARKISNGDFCLASLSKNVKGQIKKPDGDLHKCGEPECATFTTVQTMILNLSGQKPCDDEVGRLLDGDLVVETFAHAFDTDATHRGFHGGEFRWKSRSALVVGELSGVTNVGLSAGRPSRPARSARRSGSTPAASAVTWRAGRRSSTARR